MKKAFTIGLLFLLGGRVGAQEILSQPDARLLTRFSFKQFSGGVMVVQARFDKIPDTLNFILDTGSGGISLDSMTCEEFKIPVVASDTTITGIAGVRKVAFTFDKKLHLPGLTVDHLNYHVIDYSVLTSVYGEKVDGIIGYSFFSRYIVGIDFDSSLISVYSPGNYNYPSEGAILHPVLTALPMRGIN